MSHLLTLILMVCSLILIPLSNLDASPAIRLQIMVEAVPVPSSIIGKLRLWLGVRTYLHPEIGTKFVVRSTGYAPSPYQTDSTPCITAAGTRVREGTVAANFLPLGTLLKINNEVYIVEDRMNPRHHQAIDIFFASTGKALDFGRQSIEIEIMGYGEPGQTLPREEPPDKQVEDSNKPNSGLINRLRGRFSQLRRSLSSKASPDVNRYDVDCFD